MYKSGDTVDMERMTISEYRQELGLEPKQAKYRNNPCEYNGKKYHSTKEAEYAEKLDNLRHASDPAERVLSVEEQVRFKLDVNGVHVCDYILDFKVNYLDRVEYVDVKGYRKGAAYRIFTVKKALMKACYGIEVLEI